MRTDAVIDGQYVPVPNASHLGYDKWRAQVGDLIVYRQHEGGGTTSTNVGRMLGRIKYAPAVGETPAVKNFILVLALGSDMTFGMERWIDPVDVVQVRDVDAGVRQWMQWFFTPGKLPYDAETVRGLAEYGTLSSNYIDHVEDRVQVVREQARVRLERETRNA